MSQTATDTAIYSKLAGLGANFGTRVFAQLAPAGTATPYCIFFHVAGGEKNDSPARAVDLDYQIEVVSTVLSEARAGADTIKEALHNGTMTVSGWGVMAITAETPFERVDLVEGKQWWRRGDTYRIRLNKS